jgi:hypothetical protein
MNFKDVQITCRSFISIETKTSEVQLLEFDLGRQNILGQNKGEQR